jgi:hypothetical protein
LSEEKVPVGAWGGGDSDYAEGAVAVAGGLCYGGRGTGGLIGDSGAAIKDCWAGSGVASVGVGVFAGDDCAGS